MRGTRAHIAGFGTAGSLLAGAAILFVVATAFASYRGWPEIANVGATPALVLPHKTFYGVAPAVLTANAGQRAPSSAAPAHAASRTIAPGAHPRQPAVTAFAPAGGRGATPRPGVLATVPGSGGMQGRPAGCTGPACTAASATGGLPGATRTLTGAVGSGVSNAGKNLGNTVTAVSGALASKLQGVSPGVSTLVSGVGAALGNAVAQATQTAGGAVAGTGQLLGGILGSLGQ